MHPSFQAGRCFQTMAEFAACLLPFARRGDSASTREKTVPPNAELTEFFHKMSAPEEGTKPNGTATTEGSARPALSSPLKKRRAAQLRRTMWVLTAGLVGMIGLALFAYRIVMSNRSHHAGENGDRPKPNVDPPIEFPSSSPLPFDPQAERQAAQWALKSGGKSGIQSHDAADIGQEVLRAVSANVRNFRRDQPGDTFRGWLWTITKNKIRDHFRRLQERPQAAGGTGVRQSIEQIPELPDDDPDQSHGFPMETCLTHSALELVRASFELNSWQAFWRTTIDEQPPAAVAAELGMTVAAVYKAKSRVMRRLRQDLEGLID